MRIGWAAVGLWVGMTGCKSSESAGPSPSAVRSTAPETAAPSNPTPRPASPTVSASSRGVTIKLGPNGEATVEGAEEMTGDPKACAAFKACGASSELGMFCGLTRATEHDCTKALAAVHAQVKEAKIKAPPGCL
jgi:hypothetical protein